jgi:hypothetical protein
MRDVQRAHAHTPFRVRRGVLPATAVVGALALCHPADAGQSPEREPFVRLPGGSTILEAGWQLVVTGDAHCVYVVPEQWPVSRDGQHAVAPDGSIALNIAAERDTWPAHTAKVRAAMQPAVIHASTPDRLWLEQTDGQRAWHAVSATDGWDVCAARVDVTGWTPSGLVQRIAASIRVATGADKEWLKR